MHAHAHSLSAASAPAQGASAEFDRSGASGSGTCAELRTVLAVLQYETPTWAALTEAFASQSSAFRSRAQFIIGSTTGAWPGSLRILDAGTAPDAPEPVLAYPILVHAAAVILYWIDRICLGRKALDSARSPELALSVVDTLKNCGPPSGGSQFDQASQFLHAPQPPAHPIASRHNSMAEKIARPPKHV
jgi:hypothetical protein